MLVDNDDHSHDDATATGTQGADNIDNASMSKKSLAGVATNGDAAPHHKSNGSVNDPDAQQMVITSLRSQIQDLFSQVTQLNNKLVKSYDRVSDLEDELHIASSNLRNSTVKVSHLELERSQHLSALSTGLLVEKSHVTTELTRLMEKATEEAAQRGQAESARADIEKELDDLSANLFNQANTMVAEARYAQHVSKRKMEEAENALKSAEEAVGVMQHQMQTLREDKEGAERRAQEMQVSMGRGKWVEQRDGTSITRSLRLLSSHIPYQEFMLFVAHLRAIHPSTLQPPSMSTLLTLPFLQRLLTEDSEPTIRLDLAPSLNWLSRRSVLAAIHNGQLIIEPMSLVSLLSECAAGVVSGTNSSSNEMPCALCGTSVFSKPDPIKGPPVRPSPNPLGLSRSSAGTGSWSTSLFKKSTSNSYSGSHSPTPQRTLSGDLPQVFVFRVAPTQTASVPLPSLPIPPSVAASSSTASSYTHGHSHSNSQSSTMYPLCMTNWCLARLRTTCTLWAFVRTGMVDKVWEEEIPVLPPPPKIQVPAEGGNKPPVPPRKRGLWGMASALGEKAATWSEAAKKITPSGHHEQPQQQQAKEVAPPPQHPALAASSQQRPMAEKSETGRRLPPHPPTHPLSAATHASAAPMPPPRAAHHHVSPTLPPPTTVHPAKPDPASLSNQAEAQPSLQVPPPLPRRNEGRRIVKSPSPAPPSDTATATVPSLSDPVSSSESAITAVHPSNEEPSQAGSVPNATQPSSPLIPSRAPTHKRISSILPERIPLPESRPGTPSNAGPSRTTSPAPISTSGTPPPLPRRAAARGSRLFNTGEPGMGSRPGTPPVVSVSPPPVAPVHESVPVPPAEAETETGTSPVGAKDPGESPSETTATPDTEAQAKEEGSVDHQLSEEFQSATSSPGAMTPAGTEGTDANGAQEATALAGKAEETPAPSAEAIVSSLESKEASSEIGNGSQEPEESVSSNKSVFGSSTGGSPGSDSSSNGIQDEKSTVVFQGPGSEAEAKNEEEDKEQEGREDEKEVYVGEATWEERTWKELVRLREDMFWARIGALR
ncbi:hypothetical protein AX17_003188 [Amanita inopinata Kibby_2008]|nr:hypothetical protein AX17_003188 [Amanita inopinata Kibby_2008]